MPFPTDLEIASTARLKPLPEIAADAGIPAELLEPYGAGAAKVSLDAVEAMAARPRARYVVVSAITPTPLGEGKTTTTVGLGQAFQHIGRSATIAIRQPSMGPTFGIKGGAAGGGYSQVVPMELFNLHLTGDMHAVTAAHNLCAAMVDAHLFHGNEIGLDLHNITWRRVLDVNDRSLRNITLGLGGRLDGIPRESGFDITAASEVMAALALCTGLADLRQRLGRIVVGYTRSGTPVTAEEIGAAGAMAVILREAIKPNLMQTLENTPRAGPHRTVRQHRDRQLIDRRGPGRDPNLGLPAHRGGIRRGHGRRALLQHQMPVLGHRSRRCCARGDGSRAQGSLRQPQDRRRQAAARGAAGREPRRGPRRRRQPSQSSSRTCGCTAARPWSRSTSSLRTMTRTSPLSARSPTSTVPGLR